MKAVTDSSLLEALGPSIAEILQVSGAAGASVGVFDGRTHQTHLAGFGFRDLVAGLAPDEHTIYHIASLSKSFTASAIALLVADGKLSLEDRMDDVLPGFHHADEAVNSHSTLLDFLSHRTGLASKDALWQQDGHELLLGKSDTLPMVTYLEAIQPLGKRWTYNNSATMFSPTSSPMFLARLGASLSPRALSSHWVSGRRPRLSARQRRTGPVATCRDLTRS
jgi:CubicO group peptidase (beta-lactamase class C family)